jgi:hypothetical protein
LTVEQGELMATASGFEEIRARLRNSFTDPVAIDEEKQLIARKQKLHTEARDLRADLAGATNGCDGIPTLLSNLLSMRRVAEQRLKEAHGRPQKKKSEAEVAKLAKQIDSIERGLTPKRERLRRVIAEVECLNHDLAKITEQKVAVA